LQLAGEIAHAATITDTPSIRLALRVIRLIDRRLAGF